MFVFTFISYLLLSYSSVQPDIIFLELIEPRDYNNVPQVNNKPVHPNPMSHNLHPSFWLIANEQTERRRSACEAASLMPREVLQQAEKFSIVLWKA